MVKFLDLSRRRGIALEQSIKKITSGPAKKIGFKKRGEIKIDNFADLVILNESKLKDLATYENPFVFSQGIETVFVNGRPVVLDGKITGQKPGHILRKKLTS